MIQTAPKILLKVHGRWRDMARGKGDDGPHLVDRHVGRRVEARRKALGYSQSQEIARLAPRLSLSQQKAALAMVRELAGERKEED